MRNLIINAAITTKAPLSIKMPIAEGTRENFYGNFPVMPVGIGSDGEPVLTGYLPATTLRGALRRAVVLRDIEAAAIAGAHYSLKRAYAELIGQDTASEKAVDEVDLVAIKSTRESSPVLDLFGSGLGVKSRLRVGHFTPETGPVLPAPFCFPRKDLGDTEGVLELVAPGEAEAYMSRATTNSRRAAADAVVDQLKRKMRAAEKKQETKEVVDDLKAQLTLAEATASKLKEAMGDMANSSRTLVTLWALPMGLTLKGRLVVENWKERDIEMLVQALDALSRNPVLGAQSARGCGEIAGTFDFVADGELKQRVVVGDYAAATVVRS